MRTITLQLISEEVWSIIENLEKLKLVKVKKDLDLQQEKQQVLPSLAGTLSPKSAELLRQHTEQIRNEWDREF